MAKGAFTVLAYKDSNSPNDVVEEFAIKPDVPEAEIPQDQAELVPQFLNTDEVLRLYYLKNKRELDYQHYLKELVFLGQTALGGTECHPKLGKVGLDNFRTKVLNREAGILKNGYMIELGKHAILLGIIPLLIGIGFDCLRCWQLICVTCFSSANIFLVWAGTMLGVWLSFAISRPSLTFEELAVVEKDFLSPYMRLLFTGAIAILFGYLFLEEVIIVKLGSLSTQDIKKYPIAAFLVGAILGINEKILGSTLVKKTAGLV